MHMTVDETMVNLVPYLFDLTQMNEEDVSRYDEDNIYIFPNSVTTSFESI
jgi:hypothetical protein